MVLNWPYLKMVIDCESSGCTVWLRMISEIVYVDFITRNNLINMIVTGINLWRSSLKISVTEILKKALIQVSILYIARKMHICYWSWFDPREERWFNLKKFYWSGQTMTWSALSDKLKFGFDKTSFSSEMN